MNSPTPESTGSTTETRLADYAIYKPNSRGTGAVVRFSLNPAKGAMFIDAAPQAGDKQFDWSQKITMKWGLPDLGATLAVLHGRHPHAKLFHQADKASSAFDLVTRDDPDRAPLLMSVSRQDAATKQLRKLTIPVTHSEAAILSILLQAAATRLIGW
jgi:hypothetical protein